MPDQAERAADAGAAPRHAGHSDGGDSAAAAHDFSIAEVVAIAQALDHWYTGLGRQFGPLSRPQRRMLRLLAAETATRVGDLAERLGLTTAGATRMLDTLEALGYARRFRAPHTDQRQVYVALTPEGERALQQADQVFFERVRARVQGLSAAERATLARLLQKMNEQAAGAALPPHQGARE
jgi:DNA-binding MarR family transcriptional regulator